MSKKILRGFILFAAIVALLATLSACNPQSDDPDDGETPTEECTHVWEKSAAVSGTCIAYGRIDFVCVKCGATKSEPDNEYTPHAYANHVCAVCGDREKGEAEWDSGSVSVYLYKYTSTSTGEKTYNLIVDGSGATADYGENNQPWARFIPFVRRFETASGVTKIGDNFLRGAEILTNVILSSEVTEIGANAFKGCASLDNFSCGEKIVKIGSGAFEGCSSLRELYLPASATEIGQGAFFGCSVLRYFSIGLPYSVGGDVKSNFFGSMFGDGDGAQKATVNGTVYSFAVPASLAFLEIKGDGVIPDYAFKSCSSLQSVTVSGGITEIGEESFSLMTNLTTLRFTRDALEKIGAYAFSGNPVLGQDTVSADGATVTNSVVLPATLNEIGEGAFSSCSKLTSVIFAGDGVTEIPTDAFVRCSLLTSVVLPENLVKIGSGAFKNTGLKEIKIGGSVKTIGLDAFKSCTNLATIYVDSADVYAGAADATGLFNQATAVYVLEALVPEGTAKDPGVGHIKSEMKYKGLDPNGYHLWESY